MKRDAATSTHAGRQAGLFRRLGVRPRLLLAFIGISAFSIIAAATAFYSFLRVGEALDQVTQHKSPSAITSLELSRQAERVVTAAPALLTVSTGEEASRLSAEIGRDLTAINRMLADLSSRNVLPNRRREIEQAVAQLRTNLEALDELVSRRLLVVRTRKRQLQRLLDTHRKSQRLFAPWIRVQESKIERLRDRLANGQEARLEDGGEERSLAEALALRTKLQNSQKLAATLYESLFEAATTERPDRISVLTVQAQKLIRNLAETIPELDPKLAVRLGEQTAEFRDLLEGHDNLPALRIQELESLTEAEQLLTQNAVASEILTNAVDRLVEAVKTDITAATLAAHELQGRSSLALALVVGLSLLSSAAIGLYIARGLVARLKALSDSMLAIAQGDLDARIPASGYDEIGRMAEALVTFRDTAKEVKETNLREIQLARTRLTDAIESISEGFCLYDANDRLVVCNSRYRTLLYPEIASEIAPGMSFEQIVRRAVSKGFIEDAETDPETWIGERLAGHRSPRGPHTQRRKDGRWILVSERKTEDGGTVAVYSDITELKEREEELAEKSTALELLATQLAKYLSPQVYDSIFTGKQEVKVAARRKKLTISFSDIAGFTETAERLESEDLTQLLNQYLTEMSRIALAYEATIDKYVGDAIVIFFGDPESCGVKEDALRCAKMAIAMRAKMRELEG
ncbi:MAG TPA: PAS-domain containing protein, partial [Kiloniellales bacterium]|nr:PAS-domain containing protein [Kiloniellales bacterium]